MREVFEPIVAMPTPTVFTPLREEAITTAIDAMVARAKSLYTLPSVAVEVIQLTSNPFADPQDLKECILRDPALTAKILRVVNSSLFGLPREVCDLNQAIGLLGTKPLKILVLGFSLPDTMFAGVAREQLRWYWTTALARAVAAREISEQLFKTPGDEAFLAGLLQGLGVLVFAKQLGPSYAKTLGSALDTGDDLCRVEQESLGFDHIMLTAALMEHWNMPRQLVEAIANQHDAKSLVNQHLLNAPLARVLYLANLLTELVALHRLSVLPDLMEAGEAFCGLDKTQLHELIVDLQPKVSHLADVLSLDVGDSLDYVQVLIAAHEMMSELTETAFSTAPASSTEGVRTAETLLHEAVQLRAAMDGFLRRPHGAAEHQKHEQQASNLRPTRDSQPRTTSSAQGPEIWNEEFVSWITLLAGTCRSRRQPLSTVLLEVSTVSPLGDDGEKELSRLFSAVCDKELTSNTLIEVNSPLRRTVVLPACDRHEAVNMAHELMRVLESSMNRLSVAGRPVKAVVSAGVASVTLPSKSFRPVDLLLTAERCLTAAQASETSVAKSLEIY